MNLQEELQSKLKNRYYPEIKRYVFTKRYFYTYLFIYGFIMCSIGAYVVR